MTHEKRATNSIPTATVAVVASPPVRPSNNNQNHYETTTVNNSNQTHLLWHSRRLYFIAVEMIRKSRKSVDVNPTSVREKKKFHSYINRQAHLCPINEIKLSFNFELHIPNSKQCLKYDWKSSDGQQKQNAGKNEPSFDK